MYMSTDPHFIYVQPLSMSLASICLQYRDKFACTAFEQGNPTIVGM